MHSFTVQASNSFFLRIMSYYFAERLRKDPRGFYIQLLTERPIVLLSIFLLLCVRN
jgi:hypothetical protein